MDRPAPDPLRHLRRPPVSGILVLLPFVLVAGLGLAFAWPWLPPDPPGGPLLAKYAPVANGDSWLLVRYDAAGQPTTWQSQNAIVVPGLRALTSSLTKGTIDALGRMYEDSDPVARLSAVQVTEVRERQVDPDGKLSTISTVGVREPRGDFLLSWRDEGADNEIVYNPPILSLPADPRAAGSWQTTGKAGPSVDYAFSGRYLGPTAAETPLGRLDDCLEVETLYTLARDGRQLAASSSRTAYCAGVGAAESTERDAGGAQTGRTVVVAGSRRAAPPAALPAPGRIEVEEPPPADPGTWELSRIGRPRALGDSSDATVPAVWVPGDPPLVLAAGYDSDLVAFDLGPDEARGTLAWTFHPDGSVYGTPTFDPQRGRIYFGATDKRLYALDRRGLYLWSLATGDNIASRPLVVDDLVIVGSEDRNVYAVDADSGELRWERSTGGSVVSWPAKAGDVVVIGSDDGAVYAFDPASGEQRWTYAAGGPIEAPIVAVDEGVYVASRDGTLALLDADDGRVTWTANVGSPIRDAPGVGDDAVFVVDEPGYLTALRRADGTRIWVTTDQSFSYRGAPIPVGDGVVVNADDGRVYRLGPDGQKLGTWALASASAPTDGNNFFKLGPQVGGGALWLVDSNAVVRRLGPPERLGPAPIALAWADNPLGPPFKTGFLSTPPVEYRGQAVAVDDAGSIFLIDPAGGQATATGAIGGQGAVAVEPVAAGDTLLVQRGDTLYAAGLPDGRPLWQFKGLGSSVHPPAVAGDTVLWLSEPEADPAGHAAGLLHALDLASGQPRWEAPLREINVIGGAVARGGAVYVSTPPAAFDLATGQPRWQAAVGGLAVGSPTLSESGDTLYVGLVNPDGNGGAVVALDTADGRERWRADLGAAVLNPLERVWAAGGALVVPLLAPQVVGLDAASGQQRWRFDPPVPRLGAVTVEGGRVWLTLRNANLYALDADDGQPVARFRDLDLNLASMRALTQRPVLIGDRVLAPIGLLLLGFDRPAGAR